MEDNMVCIDGDKGDAAQLLGLPLILFDDREDNIVDIVNKGHERNVGVVVRRGDSSHRRVHPRNRHLVINNPHDWVYWSWRFARLFPQPEFIEGPPDRHLEADPETRSQPFHIDNTARRAATCLAQSIRFGTLTTARGAAISLAQRIRLGTLTAARGAAIFTCPAH